MDKNELRDKLLEIKEQYIEKNKSRLIKIKPYWDEIQKNVPDINNLNPYIEFCDTQELKDLWWYGRITISSAPLTGEVGRRFHYLIRDKSGYILAIVGLASDLTIPVRDKYIGWTNENKWKGKRINYLMNVQHCISIPELSNYLIGKLGALSVKSKEVNDYFENKYGHPLAAMTVTSLYGKSSIYNRLEGFKYLGVTKGFSSVLVSLETKERMREEFKAKKGKHAEVYIKEDGTVVKYGVVKTYQKLNNYDKTQRVENQRGVYFIPLADNWSEFLCQNTNELEPTAKEPFNLLLNSWKIRWLLPRIERIENEKQK